MRNLVLGEEKKIRVENITNKYIYFFLLTFNKHSAVVLVRVIRKQRSIRTRT